MNYKRIICIILLAFPVLVQGQPEEVKKWELSGYLKSLQTLFFFNDSYFDIRSFKLVDTFLTDNLLHNRLNFKWYLNDHFTFRAELRNRIFYGEFVKSIPNYGKLIDNAGNDVFDLSLVLLDDDAVVIHSMMDRLYLEYIKNNWEIRLGRQRVNWGINNVWNPNDIFNAFAFTDFDYEERPGSDVLRVRYYTGFASSFELVVKAFNGLDDSAIAALWRFNKKGYDFQLLAAWKARELVLGTGWAGNIKKASFKGELTYFLSRSGRGSFAATLGLDHSFSNSLYINAGYLYNSNGTNDANSVSLFAFELSAKNLYPYKHAVFTQVLYPFTPLINGGLAIIYSPVEVQALFLNPTFTLSIAENWDLNVVGQFVFDVEEEGYKSPLQALFLRLKYSF